VFVEGYPGKYAVVARRHGKQWYVVGVNAEKSPKEIKLPMLAGKKARLYGDNEKKEPYTVEVDVPKDGALTVVMQPGGGFVVRQ
jgi:hypothetical protein